MYLFQPDLPVSCQFFSASAGVFSLWPQTSWGGRSQNNDYKSGASCVVCMLNYTFYYIQNTVEPLQRVSQIHFRSCEFLQAATCSTVVSNVYDEAERQQCAGSHAHLPKQNQCWWCTARKQEEEKNKWDRGGKGGGGADSEKTEEWKWQESKRQRVWRTGDVREGQNETREEAPGELGGGGGDEGKRCLPSTAHI